MTEGIPWFLLTNTSTSSLLKPETFKWTSKVQAIHLSNITNYKDIIKYQCLKICWFVNLLRRLFCKVFLCYTMTLICFWHTKNSLLALLINIKKFSISFKYFPSVHHMKTWWCLCACVSLLHNASRLIGVYTAQVLTSLPSRESSHSWQCMTFHIPALICSSLASCLTLLFRRNRNSRLWWEELSGSCSSDSRINGWAKWRQLQSKNSVVTEVDLRLLGSSSFSSWIWEIVYFEHI